ncbi:MAG: hypothetical protein QOH96_1307 [Blastocatellia bacterium]|jgi:hypothetical protein|nr:hypothetical protein [Blastocatellia bacterium]
MRKIIVYVVVALLGFTTGACANFAWERGQYIGDTYAQFLSNYQD